MPRREAQGHKPALQPVSYLRNIIQLDARLLALLTRSTTAEQPDCVARSMRLHYRGERMEKQGLIRKNSND
jgi:hypothetical protein